MSNRRILKLEGSKLTVQLKNIVIKNLQIFRGSAGLVIFCPILVGVFSHPFLPFVWVGLPESMSFP